MTEWFLNDSGESFILFGKSHLVILGIYSLCFFLLIYFKKQIQNRQLVFSLIRWTAFTILISMELIYQFWGFHQGIWPYQLPFHLCAVAGIFTALTLLTMHKKMIAISFFICFIPALLALITPDLAHEFPSFRFFIFFIQHIVISLTGLFLAIIAKPGTITWRSPFETHFYLMLYALLVYFLINPLLDTNYLYLSYPPTSNTVLNLFGSGPWYQINLVFIALLVFFIQFVVYKTLTKNLQNN